MAQPYVGEIRMFAGNFAPAGWLFCEGQLLPISENETLFQLIGTTYGGDGQSTFALPDLRGRLPINSGGGFSLAETGGVEEVTLNASTTPQHNHVFMASNNPADTPNPQNTMIGVATNAQMFISDTPTQFLNMNSVAVAGGSQPHSNMQPYLCIDFIISLFGIFPSPT